ncbi:MAG: hypothetical protein AAGF79_03320 [Pseudomonadota bacterium]
MSVLQALLDSTYPGDLLLGMVTNFEIAALALIMGLALGVPMAFALTGGTLARRLVVPLLALMRAAPTFVVMFFLLNVIPYEFVFAGQVRRPSGAWIVAFALVPYAAAYVADNGRDALISLRRSSAEGAYLFLPNVVRCFLVLVMTSSTGAAIGVNEGVAVVLREAERWPLLSEKLVVFGVGVFAFGLVFQAGFALMRVVVAAIKVRQTRLSG